MTPNNILGQANLARLQAEILMMRTFCFPFLLFGHRWQATSLLDAFAGRVCGETKPAATRLLQHRRSPHSLTFLQNSARPQTLVRAGPDIYTKKFIDIAIGIFSRHRASARERVWSVGISYAWRIDVLRDS